MSGRCLRTAVLGLVGAALVTLSPRPASATQKFGPIQLSGNLQSLNLVRHPDESQYEFIMNRNVARIRLEYNWLQAGKFYSKYEIPFIETSNLFVLWRGVYDSVYDTTPHILEKTDIHGNSYNGLNVFDFGRRNRGLGRGAFQLDGLPHVART